jgi:hypothetical protein
MSVQQKPAATAFIERICDAHTDPDPEGPLVTIVEGRWAYCAGHGGSDHGWRATPPSLRQDLERELRA